MKRALVALLIILLPAVASAAPLVRLQGVYKAGKAIHANGLSPERVSAFKTAIAEAEDAVVTKKERDALALYKRAAVIYARVEAEVSAGREALNQPTTSSPDVQRMQLDIAAAHLERAGGAEDGRKLHADADRAYLNKPRQ